MWLERINHQKAFFKPTAISLGRDRLTRGAWQESFPQKHWAYPDPSGGGWSGFWGEATTPGRYDQRWRELSARLPDDRLGPNARPEDRIRIWKDWAKKGNPDWVWHPTQSGAGYIDDHGEAYPADYDGPGILFSVSVYANAAAVLHVALPSYTAMLSYTVTVRAQGEEQAAVVFVPPANGLTHARFLLLNSAPQNREFDVYVDRCGSQNARVAFAGQHCVYILPGRVGADGDRFVRVPSRIDGWGEFTRRLAADSRPGAWTAQLEDAAKALSEGRSEGVAACADLLAYAALLLDATAAETFVARLDDERIVGAESKVPKELLFPLSDLISHLPRPTPRTLVGMERYAFAACAALAKDFDRLQPTAERFYFAGRPYASGVLGRAAAAAGLTPEQLTRVYRRWDPEFLARSRQTAAYAYHAAGEYALETRLLLTDADNGVLEKRLNLALEELRQNAAEDPEHYDKEKLEKEHEWELRRYDEEILRIADATGNALKKGQMENAEARKIYEKLLAAVKTDVAREKIRGLIAAATN
jgi:hypothetical protein